MISRRQYRKKRHEERKMRRKKAKQGIYIITDKDKWYYYDLDFTLGKLELSYHRNHIMTYDWVFSSRDR